MKVNSINSSYNNLNFRAMRERAARVLIQKASQLDEADTNQVLEQVFSLAQRAAHSKILDIEAYSYYKGGLQSGLRLIDTTKSPERDIDYIPLAGFVKTSENAPIMVQKGEDEFVPLNDYMDEVHGIFNRSEKQILDSISTKQRLESAIMGLSKGRK